MKKLVRFLPMAMLFLAGVPAFAQEGGAAASNTNWVTVASGFAMAIASGLCGLGQGKATAAAAEGTARNPGAAAAIRQVLILGLALIESLALYTFVIIFLQIGK